MFAVGVVLCLIFGGCCVGLWCGLVVVVFGCWLLVELLVDLMVGVRRLGGVLSCVVLRVD